MIAHLFDPFLLRAMGMSKLRTPVQVLSIKGIPSFHCSQRLSILDVLPETLQIPSGIEGLNMPLGGL